MTQAPNPAPVAGVDPATAGDSAAGDDQQRPGMVAQLRGLYADGREMIDAEIGFQKARVSAAGRQVRTMALLAVVGIILISCALIALVVGTMIALIPLLGAWGAMGTTVAGSLVLAGLCFWLAAGRVSKVSALFASDPEPEPAPPTSGANA
jgi:hypothetical protein